MKKKLLIIGAGGHGKVAADLAFSLGIFEQIAFLDNSMDACAGRFPIIGVTQEMEKYLPNWMFFVAIGDNVKRQQVQEKLKDLNADIATLIHPFTLIGSHVTIGEGSIVMAGAVIQCDTMIGRGCIVNTGTSIDHDNEINSFVHLSPGVHLAGKVEIGARSWLGTGASVINNCTIVEGCIVGAGATVISDLLQPGTYVGTPAKRIK